jgi:succinate-semialdehyde dehydrogenase/glutarate-semialdehyde dehydrogenase
MLFHSTNPFTESRLGEWPVFEENRIEALLAAHGMQARIWATVPVSKRAALLVFLAQRLEAERESLAALITSEMGKPIAEARAEIAKCAFTARWYAENGEALLQPSIRDVGGRRGEVHFRPLGTVLGIMPWNFPFWQALRFAVPTLLAGNTVLLKHAPNVTGCALALEQLFADAGFRADVFSVLLTDNAQTAAVLADRRVKALSFTGSTATGRLLAEQCGRLLKPSVLELGGSDAFIVLEDADIERAAQSAAASRFINSGQSCIAAKRIIVHEAVYASFRQRFLERVQHLSIGDPALESTNVGPLARRDLVHQLIAQVKRSVEAGAKVLYQSGIPENGFFHPITVLEQVVPGMAVCDEETFGPVAPLICVPSEEEAISVANASNYALGAAVFTGSEARFRSVAAQLPAGACYWNSMVFSDARLPFGGNGPSGWGRELAEYGLHAFCNVQSVLLG